MGSRGLESRWRAEPLELAGVVPARALGRRAAATATAAVEERLELAGKAPVRALGRAATAAATAAAGRESVLAGVGPARATERGNDGTEDMHCQDMVLQSVGGLGSTAGRDAEKLRSAALDWSPLRHQASCAVTGWCACLAGAAQAFEVAVAVGGAGAEGAGRGGFGLAATAVPAFLALPLFAAAVEGRRTASRRGGGAHCGTAGMFCHRCSGMAAQRNRSFVMGCSPRIRRIHVVVLPALRGQHASLRPTAD